MRRPLVFLEPAKLSRVSERLSRAEPQVVVDSIRCGRPHARQWSTRSLRGRSPIHPVMYLLARAHGPPARNTAAIGYANCQVRYRSHAIYHGGVLVADPFSEVRHMYAYQTCAGRQDCSVQTPPRCQLARRHLAHPNRAPQRSAGVSYAAYDDLKPHERIRRRISAIMSSVIRLKSWVSAWRCRRAGVSVTVTMSVVPVKVVVFGLAACSAWVRHDT